MSVHQDSGDGEEVVGDLSRELLLFESEFGQI